MTMARKSDTLEVEDSKEAVTVSRRAWFTLATWQHTPDSIFLRDNASTRNPRDHTGF